MTPLRPPTWKSLVLVAAFAIVTVVVADLALQTFTKPHHLSEVEDAVEQYIKGDPDVLVIGSSHARTFEVVHRELQARTKGQRSIVAVPLEWGKLTGYAWVLEHRLRPLIEERIKDGSLRRKNLKTVILITEWWDSTEDDEPSWNLPSRAWTLRDFLRDVARHGLTDYNRNYVTTRWLRMMYRSTLANDRGHGHLLKDIKDHFVPPDPKTVAAATAFQTRKWRAMTEEGASAIGNRDEMAAMQRIFDYFQDRGIEVRVILYPRKPDTLTEKAKTTTLAAFRTMIDEVTAPRGIRLHDWTLGTPITDDDFLADFDHISTEGNRKLTEWMLNGEMADLAGNGFASEAVGRAAALEAVGHDSSSETVSGAPAAGGQ